MQRYRTALSHLNRALDEMVESGDTLVVANIAYPIRLVELAILDRQRDQSTRADPPSRDSNAG